MKNNDEYIKNIALMLFLYFAYIIGFVKEKIKKYNTLYIFVQS